MDDLSATLATIRCELDALRAEAEARRLLGRYLALCDTPLPEPGMTEEDRVLAIGALFADDGVWEGVGGTHGTQFGRHVGPAAIAAHMRAFHARRDPRLVFNTHYLCSEQVQATPDGVAGNWVQFQPWIHDDGSSLIRSSRLHVTFRAVAGVLRIARYRTENLFIGDLQRDWVRSRIDVSCLMADTTG